MYVENDKAEQLRFLIDMEIAILNDISLSKENYESSNTKIINNFNYDDIEVELINEDAILYSLTFKNDIKVYIKHYIKDNEQYETYFGFYSKNDCLYNGTGSLDDVIHDVTKLLANI